MEREIKIALESDADYRRLAAQLPEFRNERNQHNSYWDFADRRLTNAKVMLRLRVDDERAWVTVKRRPQVSTEGYFQAPESEDSVDREEAQAVVHGETVLEDLTSEVLATLRQEFALGDQNDDELEKWGFTDNVRRTYDLGQGWLAELDCTSYPDGSTDWEVEMEGDDPEEGQRLLAPFLDGVAHRPQTLTKSARLQERLDPAP